MPRPDLKKLMLPSENKLSAVLVTGGAGYIGSHTCKILASSGYLPIAYDDLSTGNRESVQWGPLVVGDIGDCSTLAEVIGEYDVRAAIHLAASAYVGESVTNPRKYFGNNTVKSISLFNTLLDSGITDVVFSSTCATYGVPESLPLAEDHPQRPLNPYGESKLAIEKVLRWYGEAYGLRWKSLRYFNAAGADPDGALGECHAEETHLIPLAIRATFRNGAPLQVFGTDYPTPDGTAVRDYVHVTDLAEAHLRALRYLSSGGKSGALNLGTGSGHSVRQVIDAVSEVTKRSPRVISAGRRPGDSPELIADPTRARTELDWTPRHSSLHEMVLTAANWFARQQSGNTLGWPEPIVYPEMSTAKSAR